MKKNLLLTFIFIMGVSCNVKASSDGSPLSSFKDKVKGITSIVESDGGSRSFKDLYDDCDFFQRVNKKSYNCDDLGKTELLNAIKRGISDYQDALEKEEDSGKKEEMERKLREVKLSFNSAQNYMDYAKICQKLKEVQLDGCDIDKISDCYDSSKSILASSIKQCIGMGAKNCEDFKTDVLKFKEKIERFLSLENEVMAKAPQTEECMVHPDEDLVNLFKDGASRSEFRLYAEQNCGDEYKVNLLTRNLSEVDVCINKYENVLSNSNVSFASIDGARFDFAKNYLGTKDYSSVTCYEAKDTFIRGLGASFVCYKNNRYVWSAYSGGKWEYRDITKQKFDELKGGM